VTTAEHLPTTSARSASVGGPVLAPTSAVAAAAARSDELPLPTIDSVREAAKRIEPHIRRTPLLRITLDGRHAVLKLESLQRTGAFKVRGALNALLAHPGPGHVVTASGGNHGVAVATAAGQLGLPATVFVPRGAPEGKTRRISAAGARLVRHGETYAEAAEAAQRACADTHGRYVPAYDDADVVAGQGTCPLEVVDDLPEVDAVVVPVGGGGLVAGTVLAAQGRTVVAVEPEGSACLHASLQVGAPVDVEVDSVAASALGATRIGQIPFAIAAPSVTSVLVTDDQLLAARDLLWEEFRIAVEPAAATPVAAWLDRQVPGDLPALVLSGANTDWRPL